MESAAPAAPATPAAVAPPQTVWTEDLVALKGEESTVGFVERTCWEEDDDANDDDDEEDEPPLPEGHVMVTWFGDSGPPVVPAADLIVLDRVVFPGDIVRRGADATGQMGTAVGVVITYDLRVLSLDTGKAVDDDVVRLSAEACRPASLFREGACVVSGEWVGAVEEVEVDVYVKFANGALGVVHACEPEQLSHAEDALVDAYYVLNESVYLTNAGRAAITWLSKTTVPKGANKRARWARVIDIKPTALHVAWLYTLGESEEPESPIAVDSVRLVEGFPHTYGSLGDVVHLPEEGRVGQVVGARTAVDVQWQDGTETPGVAARELVPAENLTEQDFWPDDFVLAPCDGAPAATVSALVRRVNAAERTCVVQSLADVEAGAGPNGEREPKEEEFSVYDVKEHAAYHFRVGSYVVRVPPCADAGDAPEAEAERRRAHYEGGWAGMVMSMRRGRLDVLWCDASRSTVAPADVLLVELEDLLDARAEEQEQEEGDEEEGDEDYDDEEGDEGEHEDGDKESDAAEAAATGASAADADSHDSLDEPADAGKQAAPAAAAAAAPAAAGSDAPAAPESAAPVEAGVGPLPPRGDAFELCDAPPAHHHYAGASYAPAGAPERGWTARVTREWSALRGGLPAGIFVRAFGARMDLLSVLIAGPRATPYADCLFPFDVQLPAAYPNTPPLVHYASVLSVKFHPNLHANGHVCLSLLGTWAGKHASEEWSAQSTLLQLLVSVQGLLLVPAPYFLEAGYDSQRGTLHGAHASRLYNELAVLKSLETMAALARRPPAPFDALIRAHIRERGPALVGRAAALLAKEAAKEALEACALTAPLSAGFTKALAHLLPTLESAVKALL